LYSSCFIINYYLLLKIDLLPFPRGSTTHLRATSSKVHNPRQAVRDLGWAC